MMCFALSPICLQPRSSKTSTEKADSKCCAPALTTCTTRTTFKATWCPSKSGQFKGILHKHCKRLEVVCQCNSSVLCARCHNPERKAAFESVPCQRSQRWHTTAQCGATGRALPSTGCCQAEETRSTPYAPTCTWLTRGTVKMGTAQAFAENAQSR